MVTLSLLHSLFFTGLSPSFHISPPLSPAWPGLSRSCVPSVACLYLHSSSVSCPSCLFENADVNCREDGHLRMIFVPVRPPSQPRQRHREFRLYFSTPPLFPGPPSWMRLILLCHQYVWLWHSLDRNQLCNSQVKDRMCKQSVSFLIRQGERKKRESHEIGFVKVIPSSGCVWKVKETYCMSLENYSSMG